VLPFFSYFDDILGHLLTNTVIRHSLLLDDNVVTGTAGR